VLHSYPNSGQPVTIQPAELGPCSKCYHSIFRLFYTYIHIFMEVSLQVKYFFLDNSVPKKCKDIFRHMKLDIKKKIAKNISVTAGF
jgi:hypothetical protein